MLSSTLLRSMRSVSRPTPATLRIASSTVWSRSLAQHNKTSKHQKKTSDFSKYQAYPQASKPAGAASTSNWPSQGARSNSNSGNPNPSKAQAETNRSASPTQNIAQATERTSSTPTESNDGNNLGKQGDSAVDSEETQSQPLPDLTRGIPSTLEYETAGSTRSTPFDLTESEAPPPSGAGGKGRGELPASAYVSSSEKKRDQFANYMYALVLAMSIGGTVYLGRNWENESEESAHPDAPSGWALGAMWNRAKARLGDQLSYYHEPAFPKLLPDPDPIFERPYTLVLSLEDLLIHNEWSREHGWRMAKRPGVDYFIRYLSQYYELVIFTSQPWAIADPVIRKLDPFHIVTWPLFREATLYEKGEYVKVAMTYFLSSLRWLTSSRISPT
jgi:import inner membrane translocase subunit TIM50